MQMGRGGAWPRECPQLAPTNLGREKTNSPEGPSLPPPCPLSSSVWELEEDTPRARIYHRANTLKSREKKKKPTKSGFFFFFNLPGSQATRDFKKQTDLAAMPTSFCSSCVFFLEWTVCTSVAESYLCFRHSRDHPMVKSRSSGLSS